MRQPITATAAAVTALLAALPALAFTPTGDPVADAFLAIVEAQEGTTVEVEAAATEGGVTTITGFSSTVTDAEERLTTTVARIAITGGAVGADGSLTADGLTLSSVDIATAPDPVAIDVATVRVSGLALPAPGAVTGSGLISGGTDYGSLAFDTVTLTNDDGVAIPLRSLSLETAAGAGNDDSTGRVTMRGLRIPPAAFEDAALASQLAALGYDGVTLDFDGEGAWNPVAGDLSVSRLSIEAVDMGTLTVTANLSGLTRAVLDRLSSDEDDPAAAMQILSDVTVSALTLAYRDAGLVPKVLQLAAREQGTTAEAFADQLASAVPLMLTAIDNPPFQEQVAEAAGAFLKDPRSLTVTADPASPLPAAQIVGTAMLAPQTIPDVLGVTIEANR